MQALLLDAEHKTVHLNTIKKPIPGPHDLLIRVHAIALNPVDALYMNNPLGETGRVIGSDFAGVIESLGSSVPSSTSNSLKPGDHVAGFLQGASSVNDLPGAFAEYLVSPWDLVWKVPENLRLEDAAAMNLCGLTAAQALLFRMGIGMPFKWEASKAEGQFRAGETSRDGFSIFIYGASTSVGLYSAQLVRQAAEASGQIVRLIGSASKRHFDMLKAEPYSYNHLVDYREENWLEQVRGFTTGEGVEYAYDCISEGATVVNTSKTLAPGAKMGVVRSRQGGAWSTPREDLRLEPVYGAVWEGLGEDVHYQGMFLPASKEARRFTVAFYKWLSQGGKLQPNPIRLMPGGLENVVNDGLRLLGSGTMEDRDNLRTEDWMRPISGEKLVYRIASSI